MCFAGMAFAARNFEWEANKASGGSVHQLRMSRVMTNPFQFLQEVRSEANKVTWPSRRETMITTALVIVMVLFASLFFLAVDQSLRLMIKLILSLGHLS
jgi:preprotein translocase subunit SecE